jgi:hypothetical protein
LYEFGNRFSPGWGLLRSTEQVTDIRAILFLEHAINADSKALAKIDSGRVKRVRLGCRTQVYQIAGSSHQEIVLCHICLRAANGDRRAYSDDTKTILNLHIFSLFGQDATTALEQSRALLMPAATKKINYWAEPAQDTK